MELLDCDSLVTVLMIVASIVLVGEKKSSSSVVFGFVVNFIRTNEGAGGPK